MIYQRKTQDVWCIETNYGYGWEIESRYDHEDYKNPYEEARKDAREYRLLGCRVRIVCRREKVCA